MLLKLSTLLILQDRYYIQCSICNSTLSKCLLLELVLRFNVYMIIHLLKVVADAILYFIQYLYNTGILKNQIKDVFELNNNILEIEQLCRKEIIPRNVLVFYLYIYTLYLN